MKWNWYIFVLYHVLELRTVERDMLHDVSPSYGTYSVGWVHDAPSCGVHFDLSRYEFLIKNNSEEYSVFQTANAFRWNERSVAHWNHDCRAYMVYYSYASVRAHIARERYLLVFVCVFFLLFFICFLRIRRTFDIVFLWIWIFFGAWCCFSRAYTVILSLTHVLVANFAGGAVKCEFFFSFSFQLVWVSTYASAAFRFFLLRLQLLLVHSMQTRQIDSRLLNLCVFFSLRFRFVRYAFSREKKALSDWTDFSHNAMESSRKMRNVFLFGFGFVRFHKFAHNKIDDDEYKYRSSNCTYVVSQFRVALFGWPTTQKRQRQQQLHLTRSTFDIRLNRSGSALDEVVPMTPSPSTSHRILLPFFAIWLVCVCTGRYGVRAFSWLFPVCCVCRERA